MFACWLLPLFSDTRFAPHPKFEFDTIEVLTFGFNSTMYYFDVIFFVGLGLIAQYAKGLVAQLIVGAAGIGITLVNWFLAGLLSVHWGSDPFSGNSTIFFKLLLVSNILLIVAYIRKMKRESDENADEELIDQL